MEKSFNLKQFRKHAFYEGGKGQITTQTRCMMNCYKVKREAGKSAHEAWQGCLNEYNEPKSTSKWAEKYS